MSICDPNTSQSTLHLLRILNLIVSCLSLVSSLLLIFLAIYQIKKFFSEQKKWIRENDLVLYILFLAICDFLFVLSFLIFIMETNKSVILCQIFMPMLVFGFNGQFFLTVVISIFFWGVVSKRIKIKFGILFAIFLPINILLSFFWHSNCKGK